MLAKDKLSKKIKYFLFIIFYLYTSQAHSIDIKSYILEYNASLQNSIISFIQNDGRNIEEGVVYIGKDRLKIQYNKPSYITIILSKKKGMYQNRNLREVEYFNTKKTYVKVFFELLTGESFFDNTDINIFEANLSVNKNLIVNDSHYKIKILYEKNPITIRKIEVLENNITLEFGFFNHRKTDKFEKDFFSMINPYLDN